MNKTHYFDPEDTQRGIVVWARGCQTQGQATGGRTRPCTMDGCIGHLIGVRWTDGALTFPCSQAMVLNDDGSLKIV
jgi:hypothetical protein